MIDNWTKYAQKKLKNKNWFPWKFDRVVGGVLMTGAECPLITRGPRQGQPNFRKYDKSTLQIVVYPTKD